MWIHFSDPPRGLRYCTDIIPRVVVNEFMHDFYDQQYHCNSLWVRASGISREEENGRGQTVETWNVIGYAGVPSFVGLGSEDVHAEIFRLLQ